MMRCVLEADCVTYEGDFVDGHLSGKGTQTWENGDKYEGDFVEGQPSGKGTNTRENDTKYTGERADIHPQRKTRYKSEDATLCNRETARPQQTP